MNRVLVNCHLIYIEGNCECFISRIFEMDLASHLPVTPNALLVLCKQVGLDVTYIVTFECEVLWVNVL